MKPVKFKEANVTFAENQPEYLPLPAFRAPSGEVISCWKLSFLERLKVMLRGKLWLRIYTFHQPLQPQLPQIERPFVR